jgi:hypothetical protein
MDVEILEHFRKKLLERPYRIMDKSGKINEVYYQPERSKREDSIKCKVCGYSKEYQGKLAVHCTC